MPVIGDESGAKGENDALAKPNKQPQAGLDKTSPHEEEALLAKAKSRPGYPDEGQELVDNYGNPMRTPDLLGVSQSGLAGAPYRPPAATVGPVPMYKDLPDKPVIEPTQPEVDARSERINDAMRYTDPRLIEMLPHMVASLAVSPVPDNHRQKILQNALPQMEWINNVETFAGMSGGLVYARLKALNILDPTARHRALRTIDSLKSLSPEDQTLFLTWANNPELFQQVFDQQDSEFSVRGSAQAGADTAGPSQDALEGGIQALLPGAEYDSSTGDLNLKDWYGGDTGQVQQIATLYRMFPQLQGRIHFDDAGLTIKDFQYSLADVGNGIMYAGSGMGAQYAPTTTSTGKAVASSYATTRRAEVYEQAIKDGNSDEQARVLAFQAVPADVTDYELYIHEHGVLGASAHLVAGSAFTLMRFGIVPEIGLVGAAVNAVKGGRGAVAAVEAVAGGAESVAGDALATTEAVTSDVAAASEAITADVASSTSATAEEAVRVGLKQATRTIRSSVFSNVMNNGDDFGKFGHIVLAGMPFGLGASYAHGTGVLHTLATPFSKGAGLFTGGLSWMSHSSGSLMLRARGKGPETYSDYDPNTGASAQFDEEASLEGSFATMLILHEASELKGAVHTVRRMEPTAAAAELNLDVNEVGHASVRGSVARSIFGDPTSPMGGSGVGARGVIEHPFRTIVDPAVRAWANNVFRMSPEHWVNGGAADSWMDKIHKIAKEAVSEEDAVTQIERYEAGIDHPLAQVMARASRTGGRKSMPSAYLDYAKNYNARVRDSVWVARSLAQLNAIRQDILNQPKQPEPVVAETGQIVDPATGEIVGEAPAATAEATPTEKLAEKPAPAAAEAEQVWATDGPGTPDDQMLREWISHRLRSEMNVNAEYIYDEGEVPNIDAMNDLEVAKEVMRNSEMGDYGVDIDGITNVDEAYRLLIEAENMGIAIMSEELLTETPFGHLGPVSDLAQQGLPENGIGGRKALPAHEPTQEIAQGPVETSGPLEQDHMVFRGEDAARRATMNDGSKKWYQSFFVTADRAAASEWGKVRTFRMKTEAKVLVEGTPEFQQLFADLKPEDRGGNYGLDLVYERAKAAGYDAIQMTDQEFMGTAVINSEVLEEAFPPGASQRTDLSANFQTATAEELARLHAAIDENTNESSQNFKTGMGADLLDEPQNIWQDQYDSAKQLGRTENTANPRVKKVVHHTNTGDENYYYYLDPNGKVIHQRIQYVGAKGDVTAITAPSVAGKGIGGQVVDAHWLSEGLTTPAAILEHLKKGSFSSFTDGTPGGADLMHAAVDRLFGKASSGRKNINANEGPGREGHVVPITPLSMEEVMRLKSVGGGAEILKWQDKNLPQTLPASVLKQAMAEDVIIEDFTKAEYGGSLDNWSAKLSEEGITDPVELVWNNVTGKFMVVEGHHRILGAEGAVPAVRDAIPVIWTLHSNAVHAEGEGRASTGRKPPLPVIPGYGGVAKQEFSVEEGAAEAAPKVEAPAVPVPAPSPAAGKPTSLGDQALIDSLDVQIAALKKKLESAPTVARSDYVYPGDHSLPKELHRIFERPTSHVEQLFHSLLSPKNRIRRYRNQRAGFAKYNDHQEAFLQKFTDKIDFVPHIYNLSRPGSLPADARDLNTTVINRVGHRMGWSDTDINSIQTLFGNVKGEHDFYEAQKALQETFVRNLPKNTPLAVREQFKNWWDPKGNASPYRIATHHPDGTTTYKPLLMDSTGRPVQVMPSDFNRGMDLPNINSMVDASSAFRRWEINSHSRNLDFKEMKVRAAAMAKSEGISETQAMRNIASTTGTSRAMRGVAAGVGSAEWILKTSTAVFKPISLIFHIPGIIVKKELDEALGNSLSPNMNGNFRSTDHFIHEAMAGSTADIGAGHVADLLNPKEGTRFTEDISTKDLIEKDDPAVWSSRVTQLDQIRQDPVAKRLTELDFNVPKLMGELGFGADHVVKDQALRDIWDESVGPTLVEHGVDPVGFAQDLAQSLREATLDHPALRGYITSGRVRVGGSLSSKDAYLYDRLHSENSAIYSRIHDKRNIISPHELRALQQQRTRNSVEMDNIMVHNGLEAGERPSLHSIRQGQSRKLANYIKKLHSSGEVKLPSHIVVDRWSSDGRNPNAGFHEHMRETAAIFSTHLFKSFKVIGKFEREWARGNFFEQRAIQHARAHVANGVEPKAALAMGEAKAAGETRDMFYDLSSRSSMERAVKNVFWYAPLTGEMLYRWAYQIPAQSGWISGMALNAAKAINYFNMLQSIGAIRQDANGQYVMPIPGAQKLSEELNKFLPADMQILFPDRLDMPLESLGHIFPSAPTVSPLLGFGFSKLEEHSHSKVLQAIGDIIDPYGYSTELMPTAVRYGLEMFGITPPDMNEDYVNAQHNAIMAQAQQYAVSYLNDKGIVMPVRYPNETDDQYMTRWTSWHDQVNEASKKFERGLLATKFIQTTIAPGAIAASSEDKEQYAQFYKDNIAPQIDKNNGHMTEQVRAEMDKWYLDHPGSQPFMESYYWYTGDHHAYEIPPNETGDKYFEDLQLHHIKQAMSPEQYRELLPAMMAKQYYEAVQSTQINAIDDGTGIPLLTNWGERRQALLDNDTSMQQYYYLHREAWGLALQQSAKAQSFYGYQSQTAENQYIQDTLNGLASNSGLFTGENGIPLSEYSTVVSRLRQQEAATWKDLNSDPSNPPSESAKNINYYFESILGPYMDDSKPIYDAITDGLNKGQDVSDLYRMLDDVKSSYTGDMLSHGGVTFPTPDEFFFGSKSGPEQKAALLNWATKPIQWLTDYQREKLGYQSFTGDDEFYGKIADFDAQKKQMIDDSNATPGSTDYENIQEWYDVNTQFLASQYGPEGTAAWAANTAAPYVRIQMTNPEFANNESWQQVTNLVQVALGGISSSGLSKGSTSGDALALKAWVYQNIETLEQQDEKFRDLMTSLSTALPNKNGGDQLEGIPLFEAVFFGNFSQQFINPDLVNAVPIPAGNV